LHFQDECATDERKDPAVSVSQPTPKSGNLATHTQLVTNMRKSQQYYV